MGYEQGTITIECDNQCAVGLANTENQERKLRHIAMRYHWTRDQIKQLLINVEWKRGTFNLADFATKKMRTHIDYNNGKNRYTVDITLPYI